MNRAMSKVILFVCIAVLLVAGGGFAFLATWDMPPPSSSVVKVVPSDQLGK